MRSFAVLDPIEVEFVDFEENKYLEVLDYP